MASFFDIQTWFRKNVSELSGGQKQLLNLASVMAMQPKVLILDEPTSQLDPIAAGEFLKVVYRINRELGTTVIISEHRLEELFPMADKVLVMDEGKLIACDTPWQIGNFLAGEMCIRDSFMTAGTKPRRMRRSSSTNVRLRHRAISARKAIRWQIDFLNGKHRGVV